MSPISELDSPIDALSVARSTGATPYQASCSAWPTVTPRMVRFHDSASPDESETDRDIAPHPHRMIDTRFIL